MLTQEEREARELRRRLRAALLEAVQLAPELPWQLDLTVPMALLNLGEPLALEHDGAAWTLSLLGEQLGRDTSAEVVVAQAVRRCLDLAATHLEEAREAHEQLATLCASIKSASKDALRLVESGQIRRAPAGAPPLRLVEPAPAPSSSASSSAPSMSSSASSSPSSAPSSPAPLTPAEQQLAEEIRSGELLEEVEQIKPAPPAPAAPRIKVEPVAPPEHKHQPGWQEAHSRFLELIEPMPRDDRELLHSLIVSRHSGRGLERLLPIELSGICDYLEGLEPEQRGPSVRLRYAVKQLDLPLYLTKHTALCEGCGAPVIWAWTATTKVAVALDAAPADGGVYTIKDVPDDKGRLVATHWGTPAIGGRHPHGKTCRRER